MANSNFLQWNPSAANQETDSAYLSDTLRSGGAANPSILPSQTANKLWYQLSTMVAALGQALANKGYTMSDASLSNLTATLQNIMTAADMSGYAPITSPQFQGTPTAPAPPISDNSQRLATTAWVDAQGYQPNLGFTPVEQGGGANQGSNKVYIGWGSGSLHCQVDGTDLGSFLFQSGFALQNLATNGYQIFPGGLIVQWGYATISNATIVNLPIGFPNQCFAAWGNDAGAGASAGSHTITINVVNNSQLRAWGYDPALGSFANTNLAFFAIGH